MHHLYLLWVKPYISSYAQAWSWAKCILILISLNTVVYSSNSEAASRDTSELKEGSNLFLTTVPGQIVTSQPLNPSGNLKSGWTLERLLQEGSQTNPRVSSGLASASAASEESNAAWQEYLPTPSIGTRSNSDGRSDTTLSLSQPIWSGGRISGAVDSAQAKAKSASVAVTETQYNLALSIVNNFQSYARARARQKVLIEFSQRLEFYRTRMNNRVAAGASPANDSELLDARIATNATQLRAAQEEERIAVTQLSQLTGISLDSASLVIVLDRDTVPSLNDTLVRAERFNPTLVRLAHDIDAAKAEVKQSRGSMLPTVSLVAQHSIVHGSTTGGNGDDSTVGIQVSLSPGAGLSSFSRTRAAQERVYALQDTRTATLQELQALVIQNYEQLNSVISRQSDNVINVRSAAAVLASYERLFVAGKRSWQDVMNAARDLSDAGLAVADSSAERLGTRARLEVYGARYSWMTNQQVETDDNLRAQPIKIMANTK